jgi:uncharacterized protein (DUF983 family)
MSARCPACGRGALFDGVLRFRPSCDVCGADFAGAEDTGDGPAVFVIFLVGIFIVPIPVILSVAKGWPAWLSLGIFIPVIILVSVWLLRRLRASLFTQQWRKAAREGRYRARPVQARKQGRT